jgi:hypothetical protein
VVAIRDGRTSTEIYRRVYFEGTKTEVVHEEFVLIDAAGRLQVPREYLDRLDIHERARVVMGEGKVEVRPEDKEGRRGRRQG